MDEEELKWRRRVEAKLDLALEAIMELKSRPTGTVRTTKIKHPKEPKLEEYLDLDQYEWKKKHVPVTLQAFERWWMLDGAHHLVRTRKRKLDQVRFVLRWDMYLKEWDDSFSFNVLHYVARAYRWERDNESKIKTPGGRARFLESWLGRTQDRPGGKVEKKGNVLAKAVDRVVPDKCKWINPAQTLKIGLDDDSRVEIPIGCHGAYAESYPDGKLKAIYEYIEAAGPATRRLWLNPKEGEQE